MCAPSRTTGRRRRRKTSTGGTNWTPPVSPPGSPAYSETQRGERMGPLRTKDLAPGIDRYRFLEHTVEGTPASRCHPEDQRTFVVLRGTVALTHAGGGRHYR